MNKVGVIYYTRTDNSKRVAEKISNKLSCELIQITDDINWKGLIGYLKAGFYSMTKRHVDIQLSGDVEAYEEYIVVGPLWAGGLAPSLITLLNQLPREKVHLVVTSIGSLVEDRAGYLSVHDITRNSGNEDAEIEALFNSFLSP
jgi:hypothetical protein